MENSPGSKPSGGFGPGGHTRVEGMSKGIDYHRNGLQRVTLQNMGFPQLSPDTESVQLGIWEGLEIPQTHPEGSLVSRMEAGEKYTPLLTTTHD